MDMIRQAGCRLIIVGVVVALGACSTSGKGAASGDDAVGLASDGSSFDANIWWVPKEAGSASADSSLKDSSAASADQGSAAAACATGAAVQQTLSSNMVICSQSGAQLNQCAAEQLCNADAGWHLCTATEFLARGGASATINIQAWIKACVRNGSTLYQSTEIPKDTLCSSCDSTSSSYSFYSRDCSGQQARSFYVTRLGVRTHNLCRRLGDKSGANQGSWEAEQVKNSLGAAVCCS